MAESPGDIGITKVNHVPGDIVLINKAALLLPLQPTEPFIAHLAGSSDLNKLRETIDILKSYGIKIGGYLPCATFRIDANEQLYWTHLGTNSTAEFE